MLRDQYDWATNGCASKINWEDVDHNIFSKGLIPKLLDSEIIKIEQKTKQISSVYSIFLFKQPKFKIASEESIFH